MDINLRFEAGTQVRAAVAENLSVHCDEPEWSI